MSRPTLINLPPPPSEPPTPSEMGPGTPNSGTTSLSGLSTTAIKDGHQGKLRPHSHRPRRRSSDASQTSTDTLAAERADRISRLAGLERVAASRSPGEDPPSGAPPGYFDHTYAHLLLKERSTVGSASATGSVGGRTTWASGSDIFDQDKLNDDDGVSSTGGLSDENASLVGFGEGANSTISGPVSTGINRVSVVSRQSSGVGGNRASSGQAAAAYSPQPAGIPLSSPSPAGSNTPQGLDYDAIDDARMVDGITFDEDIVDTTVRPPLPVSSGKPDRG
ncbi:hypothetical protein CPC735_057330 [Coccidioides posadasii C735 delta SOWgp]|uniref:Uncharacterized protein n=1 Tax=Coccidioides posadasii (strain C735) TaxID=222929 RepID=C5PIL0_COCP7|nr:hypothetical protein CPC735_057330 [Coccidioides posadasii C735 delta SOWgp]EER24363.1 hypothetical protein CPC735_057330 [Coccidioides posadasii C735 delta SOWgp]|eukprot:XP_003066508.1 hypothetical protein CPC735_057330 [Coccidioides posadasii C735 delta SOWgp]